MKRYILTRIVDALFFQIFVNGMIAHVYRAQIVVLHGFYGVYAIETGQERQKYVDSKFLLVPLFLKKIHFKKFDLESKSNILWDFVINWQVISYIF